MNLSPTDLRAISIILWRANQKLAARFDQETEGMRERQDDPTRQQLNFFDEDQHWCLTGP